MTTTIAVINESTVANDGEIAAWTAAVQKQVTEHFMPAWGVGAALMTVPRGHNPPAQSWWMVMLDDSDQAGVLGYHDLTTMGLPLGKVFAATVLQSGDQPSVVLSHETLEMLADPRINRLVKGSYNGERVYWPVEVADPVEDDGFGYLIDNVPVSDFVMPAYFDGGMSGQQFDYRHVLANPLPDIAAGGYLSYEDHHGWHQIYGPPPVSATSAEAWRYKCRPLSGSRRHRRMIGPGEWLRSTAPCA